MNLLNETYPISDEQIKFYRDNNYIKLKNVLDEQTIKHFNQKITNYVERATQNMKADESDTYSQAFQQLFNLWMEDESVKPLVFSKRIAEIAAKLMEVEGVRLYHDQALYKVAGGGITPWHADQHYWPLASEKTITVWIPLQKTSLEMGALEFSAASHKTKEGRNLEISDESEEQIEEMLSNAKFDHVREPFDLGEVSFHSGWLYHRAGANKTNQSRKAMTIIYMDMDMILKSPENDNQQRDWERWCTGAKPGELIDTPKNPILWQK
jgi:ectoine hydroxylase-related dioxygenase (phytanoyl-CoA dioxygenase family)